MLERYLHIRIDAKKKALDRLDESRNSSGRSRVIHVPARPE
jgi:hypothetical protein